jgi:O-antigen ligase
MEMTENFKLKLLPARLFEIMLLVASFSLPLLIPQWHGKVILLVIITWLLMVIQQKRIHIDVDWKNFVVWSGVLILFGLGGLIYTVNYKSGFAIIESTAPLFLLPLIISSTAAIFEKKNLDNILIFFLAGVVVLNLASLAFISYNLWDPVNLQSNIIIANNHIVQIHPAFLSLYISFCVFFLVDQYFPVQTKDRRKLGWILFSLFILIGYLIWINSRTGILSFSVTFLFYSIYRFKAKARIVSLAILPVFLFIIFLVPFSRERFFNTPQLAARGEVAVDSQDPNIYPLVARTQILDCSIELLNGSEFFYGYGTGDYRDVLRACFKEKNYSSLYEKGLDSHNEYFAQIHRHGIAGLFIFAALLIVPFRYALKYKSPLLAVFIILFAITALFENVFSSQKGVTFFALFCPLLMLYARKNYESVRDSGGTV